MIVYRPPSSSSINTSFAELTISLSEAVNKFGNLIVTDNFNIDIIKKDCSGFDDVIRLISQTKLNLKHVIAIITNRQLIYFSRTNHYLFKEPPQMKLKLD